MGQLGVVSRVVVDRAMDHEVRLRYPRGNLGQPVQSLLEHVVAD